MTESLASLDISTRNSFSILITSIHCLYGNQTMILQQKCFYLISTIVTDVCLSNFIITNNLVFFIGGPDLQFWQLLSLDRVHHDEQQWVHFERLIQPIRISTLDIHSWKMNILSVTWLRTGQCIVMYELTLKMCKGLILLSIFLLFFIYQKVYPKFCPVDHYISTLLNQF